MRLLFRDKSLEKICRNTTKLEKKFGLLMAEKINTRIRQLECAESIENLLMWHVGRCHSLAGKRKGQYAMDLINPYRLIFTLSEDTCSTEEVAIILEIVDYH